MPGWLQPPLEELLELDELLEARPELEELDELLDVRPELDELELDELEDELLDEELLDELLELPDSGGAPQPPKANTRGNAQTNCRPTFFNATE